MKGVEVGSFGDRDLVVREFELSRELANLKFRHALGQVEKSSELRLIRRERARVKTEVRRREIQSGLLKDDLYRRHSDAFDSARAVAVGVTAPGEKAEGLLAGLRRRLSGEATES